MPQFLQYPVATSLLQTDAFVIDRQGVGTMYIEGLSFLSTSLLWTGNSFYQGASPPTASLFLGGWTLPVTATFPDTNADALLYGWGAHTENNPTSNFVININHNDVFAATLTFTPTGTWTYASATGNTFTVNKTVDWITAYAPATPDATMNNFFFTMAALVP